MLLRFSLIITLKIDKMEPECNKESQMHNLCIEAAWMPLIWTGLWPLQCNVMGDSKISKYQNYLTYGSYLCFLKTSQQI